ncbi:DUF1963 domain-containing protein [Streptomyces sp. NPDC088755]|uniref:DUF1963 domain-containing protein n=1 Tax=Streptomyces sp. NPDC088755 TaxID=3365888 RepID=UPI0038154C10
MTNDIENDMYEPVVRVLGPEMGEHWRARTRPAFALTIDESEAPVVGQLHGLPSLPADMPWPIREGYGPMTHLATIRCAELPEGVLDFHLPKDGTLLFFRWSFADCERFWESGGGDSYFSEGHGTDPGAGARLLYIPGSTDTSPRSAPDGVDFGETVPLHLVGTFASRLSWDTTEQEYPVPESLGDALAGAFDEWEGHELLHAQIGGHQNPVQNPSVNNAAGGDLRGPHGSQAGEDIMIMLAAIYDCKDEVETYWFIQPQHLKHNRFDEVYYDYQA